MPQSGLGLSPAAKAPSEQSGHIRGKPGVITFKDAQRAAAARCTCKPEDCYAGKAACCPICRGLTLTRRTLGPAYRITCHDGLSSAVQGRLLATSSGFVAPLFGLVHCDSMQVFTKGLRGAEAARVRGGTFWGLSLIIVAAVLSHSLECGCRKAEILAIRDNDEQHRRLVRYYQRLGFQTVVDVGERGLRDLPHLLVWGGAGARMDGDIQQLLQRWGPRIRSMADWQRDKGAELPGGA